MATVVVTHSKISTKPPVTDPSIIGGPDWNGNHVVTGLENVPNVDTTNAANITSGTLPAGRLPALTGDVTTTVGTVATTIANNAVTNAKAAQMAATTIKGNSTAGLANPSDLTGGAVEQMLLFTQVGTGAVQRFLDAKVKEIANSVADFGAVGNGIADETTAFNNTYTAGGDLYVGPGSYLFSAADVPAAADVRIRLNPSAVFVNHAWDMINLLTDIGPAPVFAFDTFYKNVTSSYNLYAQVVGTSIVTKASTATPTVVSLFANCEVSASGAIGFGANFGTLVSGAGTGVGLEIDSHVTNASGLSTALALDSVGSFASQAAIVIQPNGPSSPFLTGISFNNAAGNSAITNNAIQFPNTGTAQRFLFSDPAMMFTSALIETNVFIAGPSQAGSNSLLRVDASTSGSPKLSAAGSATNAGVVIEGKGTGGVQLVDGNLGTSFSSQSQGGSPALAFYGASPVLKQTGVAVTAAAIFTALQNLGLIGP